MKHRRPGAIEDLREKLREAHQLNMREAVVSKDGRLYRSQWVGDCFKCGSCGRGVLTWRPGDTCAVCGAVVTKSA